MRRSQRDLKSFQEEAQTPKRGGNEMIGQD